MKTFDDAVQTLFGPPEELEMLTHTQLKDIQQLHTQLMRSNQQYRQWVNKLSESSTQFDENLRTNPTVSFILLSLATRLEEELAEATSITDETQSVVQMRVLEMTRLWHAMRCGILIGMEMTTDEAKAAH